MLSAECRTQCSAGVEVVGHRAYRGVDRAVTFLVIRRGSSERGIVLSAKCHAERAVDVEVFGSSRR